MINELNKTGFGLPGTVRHVVMTEQPETQQLNTHPKTGCWSLGLVPSGLLGLLGALPSHKQRANKNKHVSLLICEHNLVLGALQGPKMMRPQHMAPSVPITLTWGHGPWPQAPAFGPAC